MTVANNINIADAKFFKVDKKADEKVEEKVKYNSFMNFMTDIIVKYGLNENLDRDD